MPLKVETLTQICNNVGRQVQEGFKDLTLHYVVHHHGQRVEALSIAGEEILYHPAAETAMQLLNHPRQEEGSSLIGMAVARKNIWFGLASADAFLALCSINADQYESIKAARLHAYHMAWHAIDTLQYHQKLPNNNIDIQTTLVRRRNKLEITASNLQADVFAAVMSAFEGDSEAARQVATQRSIDVLTALPGQHPEHFPFPLATDTTMALCQAINKKPLSKKKRIREALQAGYEISQVYGKEDIKSWLTFASSAQEMAWRGAEKENILGAAINTSENTNVRAISHLIAELSDNKPASIARTNEHYSAFADKRFNEKIHEEALAEIFEDVIAQGLHSNSANIFMDKANNQNQLLLEGEVMGWCAAALQASGKVFDQALKEGVDPSEPARREFAEQQQKTSWNTLQTLGEKIIDYKRQGKEVRLEDIENMSSSDKTIKQIKKSVAHTLQDPGLKKEYAPLPAAAPKPQEPAPQAAPVLAAAPAPGRSSARRPQMTKWPAQQSGNDKDSGRRRKKKQSESSETQSS